MPWNTNQDTKFVVFFSQAKSENKWYMWIETQNVFNSKTKFFPPLHALFILHCLFKEALYTKLYDDRRPEKVLYPSNFY